MIDIYSRQQGLKCHSAGVGGIDHTILVILNSILWPTGNAVCSHVESKSERKVLNQFVFISQTHTLSDHSSMP